MGDRDGDGIVGVAYGPHCGADRASVHAQNPLLVMRIGDGLRLAATRDVSQHVSFTLRRNTMGKSRPG